MFLIHDSSTPLCDGITRRDWLRLGGRRTLRLALPAFLAARARGPGRPRRGALIKRVVPPQGGLPSAMTLPEQSANDGNLTWPGQDAGFLGRAADPWLLTCEPAGATFQIDGLALPADVSTMRFDGRTSL